jgi:hypothetical protein
MFQIMEKSTKKKEDGRRRLYDLIKWRMKEIHRELLLLCVTWDRDMLNKGTANVICGLRMNLFYLEDILHDLFIEEKKPGTILKEKGEFPDLVHLH